MTERCERSVAMDVAGGAISVICALHCLLLPILLPFASTFIHNTWIEVILTLAAVAVGSFALAHGYRRHGFRWPAISFGLGMLLIILGNWVVTCGRPFTAQAGDVPHWASIPFVALGGVFVVLAHLLNFYLDRVRVNEP
ncbi:MAG: MerC domain-containing protein [Fimbriimonadales bacterium]